MADEKREQMLRHVQQLALGTIVDWLLSRELARSADPNATAEALERMFELISAQITFPEAGAAWSDLAAQELRDTFVRHVHRARALASGEPFDPTSYQGGGPRPELVD